MSFSSPGPSQFRLVSLTFLWGLFCACSWTWCIGMYLPRILIERFGWWGFIVFAVPNVVGCAGFGYVVRNRMRSESMTLRHRGEMVTFSSITVAYHLFFIVWLMQSLIGGPESVPIAPLTAAAVVFALAGVFSFLPNRDWLWLSAVTYAVSIAAFVKVGTEGFERIAWSGEWPRPWLAGLSPVIIFGFLVCPYLDLTFHRAIQNAPSRHSFAVFGVTFAVMILLSCAIWFGPAAGARFLPGLVLAHLLAQSVFTVGAHLREIRVSSIDIGGARCAMATFLPLAAAAILPIAAQLTDSTQLGEHVYLGFLSLYGTVLPLWFVWRAIRSRAQK